jgi:hypothetical protein
MPPAASWGAYPGRGCRGTGHNGVSGRSGGRKELRRIRPACARTSEDKRSTSGNHLCLGSTRFGRKYGSQVDPPARGSRATSGNWRRKAPPERRRVTRGWCRKRLPQRLIPLVAQEPQCRKSGTLSTRRKSPAGAGPRLSMSPRRAQWGDMGCNATRLGYPAAAAVRKAREQLGERTW